MEYNATVNSILEALKTRIGELRDAQGELLIPDVRIACIDGFGRIFDMLPDLNVPSAVLVAGTTEYEEAGAIRKINVGIILLSAFSCAQEDVQKTYDRLERLCSGMTGEVPGRSLSLSGCELILNNVQPLEIDDGTNTAFVLDLTANTSFRMSV